MKSERALMVDRIEKFLNENGLNEVYGVIAAQKGRTRTLTFCKARILDGVIEVYGTKFIKLNYKTAIRALPQYQNLVFESEANLLKYIKAAFVDYDYTAAESVPIKE